MNYLALFEQALGNIIGEKVETLINRKLMEGGNVFKAAGWSKENPVMQTTRISREDVPATVAYLEKLTTLPLKNNLLGSTGITDSSGDMDIAVDMNSVSKEALIQQLTKQGVEPADIVKTGDSVHYKSPIAGAPNEFVQVDFMFVPNVPFASWSNKSVAGSAFKGVYKQRLMADLTRTVNPDWKWNHFKGVISRTDNSSVFGFDPDAIAKGLLGPNGKRTDLESVESILSALQRLKHQQAAAIRSNYRQTLAREPKGPQIPDDEVTPIKEAAKPTVGREFQHLEDYVFINGVAGVKQAITDLSAMSKKAGTLEVKWDGSPAILFGRDESGAFHFGDKYSKEVLSTAKDVYAYFTRTSTTDDRKKFAYSMAELVPIYDQATPRDFRGFIEAGLLYSGKPPVNEKGEYYFRPNTVTYFVDKKSTIGQRVGNSKSGCAATAFYDQIPAAGGQRRPVGDHWRAFNSRDVVVLPPKFSEGPAKVDTAKLKQIYTYAQTNAKALEQFIAPEQGLTDIKKLIYTYINNNVDTAAQVASLGTNFIEWLSQNGVSAGKLAKLQEKIQANPKGPEVLFNIIRSIMQVKDDLIDNQETSTLGSMGMRGELGAFGPGAEGFVYDPEGGTNPRKLVKRTAFTAANRARSRVNEAVSRTGDSDTAVVGWGRGMGHKGHMYLASAVITKAEELGADPYFMLSRTVGTDDPLKPEEKLSIYRKVFPEYKNIFQVATNEEPTLPALLYNLHQQGYKNAVVVVGEDQKQAFQFLANPTKKTGKLPVEFDNIKVISRQETNDPYASEAGPRATPMREILKDANASYEDKLAVWRDAMPEQLSDDEVKNFMTIAAARMGVPLEESVTEADNPNQFGGNSQSAIPGTPSDLLPQPDPEEVKKYHREMADLKRFMGR
jgi:hypothetical protein